MLQSIVLAFDDFMITGARVAYNDGGNDKVADTAVSRHERWMSRNLTP